MLTILTPTGGRQKVFDLCQQSINRQTYTGPIQWLITDDCEPKTRLKKLNPNISLEYFDAPKKWKAGFNTQRLNLDFLLPKIKGEYIFFCEDDDCFSEKYLETYLAYLKYSDIVGEANSKYYNLGVPGFKTMSNFKHSSLTQTAITRKLLPLLDIAINSGNLYIDIALWKLSEEAESKQTLLQNSSLSVGMKGLPGRAGITTSHSSRDYFRDAEYRMLKLWIGEARTAEYLQLLKPNTTDSKLVPRALV